MVYKIILDIENYVCYPAEKQVRGIGIA